MLVIREDFKGATAALFWNVTGGMSTTISWASSRSQRLCQGIEVCLVLNTQPPARSDAAAIYSGGSSQKQKNVMRRNIANDFLVDNGGTSEHKTV